ncbi:MAG: NADH-quinone oxidoreductase subunit C [Desulfobacteraceae bacterium]|nr:NADH-quinone oxidoreductase subunit C [Desulfobacteraceae bacterium]
MKASENRFEGLPICAQTGCRYEQCGCVMTVFLDTNQLKAAAQRLFEAGYHIEDIAGADFAEGIEVLYHFDHFDHPGRVTVRVLTSHDDPEIPTISDIFSGAQWHERECFDFFGVKFSDHPQFRPLLLPAEFAQHPLLKPEKNRESLYLFLGGCDPVTPSKGERYHFEAPEPAEAIADADQSRTEKDK